MSTGAGDGVAVRVAEPDQVNVDAVAGVLPYGTVNVTVVKGGLDVLHEETGDISVMANAAAY